MFGNRDHKRGIDARRAGRPFSFAENIDWQRGWEDSDHDIRLDAESDREAERQP